MKLIRYPVLAALVLIFTSFTNDSDWVKLLDKNLSKWEMYLSYRHKNSYDGKIPTDASGKQLMPIGYHKNVANMVSVKMINNQPVLRLSGEIYGCVFTKQEYQNYHLKLKVKLGDKKWPPRLNEPKDSGLLYHSQGPAGVDYWRAGCRRRNSR